MAGCIAFTPATSSACTNGLTMPMYAHGTCQMRTWASALASLAASVADPPALLLWPPPPHSCAQETFRFNLINENSAEIKIYDEDTLSRDDVIGEVMVPLAKAREQGGDALQLPVVSAKSRKQRGFLAVRLQWAPNSALRPQHAQQPMAAPYPPPMPMGMPMGYPPAAYPYPYATPPPSAYYAPMPGYAQYPPPAMHYPPMPMPLPAQARQ